MNSIRNFYRKHPFERIVIYIFMTFFVGEVVFNQILNQSFFEQATSRQWIFFILIALDYLITFRHIIHISLKINAMSAFGFVLLIMCLHGLCVGVLLRNSPFVIFNDLVPLMVIAINIFRMQSEHESRPIDMLALLKICTLLAIVVSVLGLIKSLSMGLMTAFIAAPDLYFPMLLAGFLTIRPFPKWIALSSLFMIVLAINDFNRTTMAFIALVTLVSLALAAIKKPARGIIAVSAVLILGVVFISTVPKESKTYQRAIAFSEINTQDRQGSVGERNEEWETIITKLESKGQTVRWLGLGFGGVYDLQMTHTFIKNNGHAHYAWAWFNLRFGKIGYVYMMIMIAALLYNSWWHLMRRRGDTLDVTVGLLGVFGFLYCFTYVNSIFILSGLHFFRPFRSSRKE